jgi:hypothetical protein
MTRYSSIGQGLANHTICYYNLMFGWIYQHNEFRKYLIIMEIISVLYLKYLWIIFRNYGFLQILRMARVEFGLSTGWISVVSYESYSCDF